MTIVSKSESNDKVSLHSNFFWTDVKEIFYYFTYFSVEEWAQLSEKSTKIAICIDALA